MKVTLAIGLLVSGMGGANIARASDWAQACEEVGHFADLVAVERDQHMPADEAISTTRRILDQPPMITAMVAAEIARQVYGTPQRPPAQEDAALRSECLTPVGKPNRESPRRAQVVVLAPIELNLGVNRIERFTTNGRDATIKLTWQSDGGQHGHDVFSASVADAGPVVMPGGGYTVRDDPDHDLDMRSSVRFARGKIDGTEVTLLLTAAREPGSGPTLTIYRVFRLTRQQDRYRFVPVLSEQLAGSCNADMALSIASGLPLRRSYRGAVTDNGCSPSSQIARQE